MAFKKWMLKALVQKTISLLPFRNRINFWFQKYITKGVQLDGEHLQWKLTHARDHLAYWGKYGGSANPVCLELGTGWYPIVPIMLYLHGAGKIQTIDLNAHLTRSTLDVCCQKILHLEASGQLNELFPGIKTERWKHFRIIAERVKEIALSETLAELQIQQLLGDARRLPIPDDTFDFICSNNTFEHIYPAVLRGILLEFKRVLKPGGVMSHFIDLSDHFAHFDPSINIYNFLRFGKQKWSRIDNDIQPQNRWRWPQYKSLYRQVDVPITEEAVREGDPELLKKIPVHREWTRFTPAELAISHGYLVSRLE